MTARTTWLYLLSLLAASGCAQAPPAPPPPPPSANYRSKEALNYIGFFKTQDTKQWELAKERLVGLGPTIIPTLFAAMEENAGEVDFCCQDVLKRMGTDAVPYLVDEIRRGDAGYTGKALAKRQAFRRGLVAVLGEQRTPAARDALCRVLREDSWVTARRNAAFCLGERKDPAAVPALIEALRKDPDEAVQATARRALTVYAGGRDLGGANADAWELWWKRQSSAPSSNP